MCEFERNYMALSVSKKQIKAFITESLFPHFQKEWFVHNDINLLRIHGYCLQGISLYFLRNLRKLRTYYFVQLLNIPAANLHVTIGDSIKETTRKKGFLGRFKGEPKEYLFDWPARLNIADHLIDLITSQTQPQVSRALTPHAILTYIKDTKSGSPNLTIRWTEAVSIAMCGELETAQHELKLLEEERSNWLSASADKPHLTTDLDIEKQKELKKVLQVVTDKRQFDEYCHLTAVKTMKALRIPEKYLTV